MIGISNNAWQSRNPQGSSNWTPTQVAKTHRPDVPPGTFVIFFLAVCDVSEPTGLQFSVEKLGLRLAVSPDRLVRKLTDTRLGVKVAVAFFRGWIFEPFGKNCLPRSFWSNHYVKREVEISWAKATRCLLLSMPVSPIAKEIISILKSLLCFYFSKSFMVWVRMKCASFCIYCLFSNLNVSWLVLRTITQVSSLTVEKFLVYRVALGKKKKKHHILTP